MTPEQRYENDPLFNRLVNVLMEEMLSNRFTKADLREAVVLAKQISRDRLMATYGEKP